MRSLRAQKDLAASWTYTRSSLSGCAREASRGDSSERNDYTVRGQGSELFSASRRRGVNPGGPDPEGLRLK
jgi:hypothetical protein